MPREKSKWRPPRGERTNAEHGDGPTRTSEEGRSCGRSKGVGPSGCLQRPTGNRRRPWRQRSRRLLGGSGVSREAPAPFCERPGVKLLRPTRHPAAVEGSDLEKERAFVQAFKYLRNRIGMFISLPLASLDAGSLQAQLRQIGESEGATSAHPGAA